MSEDLSQYTIIELSESQNSTAIANTWTSWNRGFPPSDFQRLCETLCSPRHAWTSEGRFKSWGLVLRSQFSDPNAEIYCHCDTLRRNAVLSFPDGKKVEAASYGIASVFTPEKYRGKGYATRMLQLLHYVLAPESALPEFPKAWGERPRMKIGDAAFSVLYSDVGPTFYSKATIGAERPGWIARPVLRRVWALGEHQGARPNITTNEAIRLDGMHALEQQASNHIKAALPRSEKIEVGILPDPGWFRMFSTREALAREAGDRPDPSGPIKRAAFHDDETKGYFVYTAETMPLPPGGETRPKRLVVNWMKEPVAWKQVERVARAEWCTEIEVWGHPEFQADAGVPQPRIEDKDHIPCLASYISDNAEVEWRFNDHCFWC